MAAPTFNGNIDPDVDIQPNEPIKSEQGKAFYNNHLSMAWGGQDAPRNTAQPNPKVLHFEARGDNNNTMTDSDVVITEGGNIRTFSFTVPADVYYLIAEAVGGGGGGGRGDAGNNNPAGSGGNTTVEVNSDGPIVVATGGAGGQNSQGSIDGAGGLGGGDPAHPNDGAYIEGNKGQNGGPGGTYNGGAGAPSIAGIPWYGVGGVGAVYNGVSVATAGTGIGAGGGGGHGGGSNADGGGGGGSGGWGQTRIDVAPGDTIEVILGAGGTGNTGGTAFENGANGSVGGAKIYFGYEPPEAP